MFNTIILVIIAFVLAIYTLRAVNAIENGKSPVSDIIIVLLCLAIICQAKSYENPNTHKYAEAYANGFDDAIESAEFYKFSNDGYFIKFGNNIHEYKF